MESEVIESDLERELRTYADRLADGDADLLDEGESESGAFVGEQLRRLLERAAAEGEIERVLRLPWGVGACFTQAPGGRSTGAPGIFFAVRTPGSAEEPDGRRYWRFVECEGDVLLSGDLEILRRIDPTGSVAGSDTLNDVDLEQAWTLASADIVAAHNVRADVREEQDAIGPRQRWALDVLRNPGVAYATGADEAEEALSVGRSSAVRRALGTIETDVRAGAGTLDDAAVRIVGVVMEFGLRAVSAPAVPAKLDASELGVVCWMAVLPAG